MRLDIEYLPHYDLNNWGEIAYKHPDDSGFDLRAATDKPVLLAPGEYVLIPTGVILALHKETVFEESCHAEIQIRPRSGLAAKAGISIVNTPGTVDFGYRGEVKVTLINLGKTPFTVTPGDRIAQGVVTPVFRVNICRSALIDKATNRHAGGFGSTGTR